MPKVLPYLPCWLRREIFFHVGSPLNQDIKKHAKFKKIETEDPLTIKAGGSEENSGYKASHAKLH